MKKELLCLSLLGLFAGTTLAKDIVVSLRKEIPYKKVYEYTSKNDRTTQVYSGTAVVEGTLYFDRAAMDDRYFSFEVSKKDRHKLPGKYNIFNIRQTITDNEDDLKFYAKYFGIDYKKCFHAAGKAKVFIGEYNIDWAEESYVHVDASLLEAIEFKMQCVN